jgi:hypothetical protein
VFEDRAVVTFERRRRLAGVAVPAVSLDRLRQVVQTIWILRPRQQLGDGDAVQREGRADLAGHRHRGEEAVALQGGDRLRLDRPAELAGEDRRRLRAERRGRQVGAVGGDRVQGLGGQPLRALVEEERPDPELGALLEQGREVPR